MELVASHYTVGPQIGSGNHGVIYSAVDSRTGEYVAVKNEPRRDCWEPQLSHENDIYTILGQGGGIIIIKQFENLNNIFNIRGSSFH